MGKVGRFITDPKAGAYCTITLDSGEKIVVNHDKGGMKGGTLAIEKTGFLGFGGRRVFECSLDSAEGKTALGRLTQGAHEGSARATPLGAFVEYVKDCKSVDELTAKCVALLSGH